MPLHSRDALFAEKFGGTSKGVCTPPPPTPTPLLRPTPPRPCRGRHIRVVPVNFEFFLWHAGPTGPARPCHDALLGWTRTRARGEARGVDRCEADLHRIFPPGMEMDVVAESVPDGPVRCLPLFLLVCLCLACLVSRRGHDAAVVGGVTSSWLCTWPSRPRAGMRVPPPTPTPLPPPPLRHATPRSTTHCKLVKPSFACLPRLAVCFARV